MLSVNTLYDHGQEQVRTVLPPGLRAMYDGDLTFPSAPATRPYVFGNFVTTLDGVISYRIPGQSGGGTISGSNPGDRFIMGLLRASADAVVVGAGTVHDVDPKHLWVPSFTYPEAKDLYREYRVGVLGKPEQPLMAIVTGTGSIDLSRAIFHTPEMRVVLITSAVGQAELMRAGADRLAAVQVRAVEKTTHVIDPEAILGLLFSEFGVHSVLHEGGSTLFGYFVARNLVDELFITFAPQIAGRLTQTARPGIVQGVEFLPTTAPWWHLISSKQSVDHLYLRYRR